MLKICHQIELREEAVPIKYSWGGRIPVTTQGVRKERATSHPQKALHAGTWGGLHKEKSLPSAFGYAFLSP